LIIIVVFHIATRNINSKQNIYKQFKYKKNNIEIIRFFIFGINFVVLIIHKHKVHIYEK